ncbi:hypothetical protein WBP06_25070 [Novosphingobium sp. BL-8H]|uniref:hypothetical protein n=1 Tax=Novosphingobium sp. BL-8H TaxID=3127640 RepID=UPI003756F7D4
MSQIASGLTAEAPAIGQLERACGGRGKSRLIDLIRSALRQHVGGNACKTKPTIIEVTRVDKAGNAGVSCLAMRISYVSKLVTTSVVHVSVIGEKCESSVWTGHRFS